MQIAEKTKKNFLLSTCLVIFVNCACVLRCLCFCHQTFFIYFRVIFHVFLGKEIFLLQKIHKTFTLPFLSGCGQVSI